MADSHRMKAYSNCTMCTNSECSLVVNTEYPEHKWSAGGNMFHSIKDHPIPPCPLPFDEDELEREAVEQTR